MNDIPPMDNNVGGNIPQGDITDNMDSMEPMNNSYQGGDPNIGDNQNQFDTNFDAGVEADEDADPKKYIQQLTGKLSQKLNSYNNENGEDSELSKYVGKMIIKQVSKGLDDKDKQDIIKTIKSTNTEGMNDGDDGVGTEDNPADSSEEITMNECTFSKSEFKKLFESFNAIDGESKDKRPVKANDKMKSSIVFRGKKFFSKEI